MYNCGGREGVCREVTVPASWPQNHRTYTCTKYQGKKVAIQYTGCHPGEDLNKTRAKKEDTHYCRYTSSIGKRSNIHRVYQICLKHFGVSWHYCKQWRRFTIDWEVYVLPVNMVLSGSVVHSSTGFKRQINVTKIRHRFSTHNDLQIFTI